MLRKYNATVETWKSQREYGHQSKKNYKNTNAF